MYNIVCMCDACLHAGSSLDTEDSVINTAGDDLMVHIGDGFQVIVEGSSTVMSG